MKSHLHYINYLQNYYKFKVKFFQLNLPGNFKQNEFETDFFSIIINIL